MNIVNVDALLPAQVARSALRRKVLVEPAAPMTTPGCSRGFRHGVFESAQELFVF